MGSQTSFFTMGLLRCVLCISKKMTNTRSFVHWAGLVFCKTCIGKFNSSCTQFKIIKDVVVWSETFFFINMC